MSHTPASGPGLLVVGREDVRRALPMADCITAVELAMRAFSRGDANIPLRTVFALPQGRRFFGVMSGYLGEPRGLGAKILTVYPENAQRGLPSHVGVVVLFDAEMGHPLAVMDAGMITALRTAAATAVATRALAREDADRLAILGTGEQAVTHLEALALVRPLRSVSVWGRTSAKARKFADEQSARFSLPIEARETADEAVDGADIVCTVTAAREPILRGAALARGTHVNLVGSSRLPAREADDEVVARSRFFVDSKTSAAAEAAELRHAQEAGLVTEGHVLGEIGEVLSGRVPGRTGDREITVYKSHGIAAQDLAAANAIYERAVRDGIGTRVPF
ncbi:MAG TPA: ornithine cyclodeaminase family protein [Steroidobacteraceae bacterium]|nr:ornithine cyclodeaminase family protein [Steroidobacteraceae bacterium]